MHQYEIKPYCPTDLSKRAYLAIYIEGRRYREYNGQKIAVDLKPNRAKSAKERRALLGKLEFEFRKKLNDGSYQKLLNKSGSHDSADRLSLDELFNSALNQKKTSNLSKRYVSDLKKLSQDFLSFLKKDERDGGIKHLKALRIQQYLDNFRRTPQQYMNKWRHMSALIGVLKRMYDFDADPMRKVSKIKTKATLHKIYTQEQLRDVLDYLKVNHENMYLCCLISYGCFLRPHIEVRNLKSSHFKNNCTEIHLSGNENKSGRIRVVYVPDYVRDAVYDRVQSLSADQNLFSMKQIPFNVYYFNTVWSRHFKTMLDLGLVEQNQTIYSFRHTAAVNVYKKTKDLHLLQQLLGHSNMIVTLKYLRGLGVHNMEELKEVMPVL